MVITNLLKKVCTVYLLTSFLFMFFSTNLYAAERTFKNSVSKNNDIFRILEEQLIKLRKAGVSNILTDTYSADHPLVNTYYHAYFAKCNTINNTSYVSGETLKGEEFPECGQICYDDTGIILKQGVDGDPKVIDIYCKVFGYDGLKKDSLKTQQYDSSEARHAYVVSHMAYYWVKFPYIDTIADEFICESTKECVEDINCGKNQRCTNYKCVNKQECTQDDLSNCSEGQTCENNKCQDVYECSKSGNVVTLTLNGQTSETKTDSCTEGTQTIYTCSSDNKSITSSNNTCQYRCNSDGVTCDDNECNTSADCTNSSKPKCVQNACVACQSGTIFDSSTNTCVECTTDNVSNCAEGQACENNTCQDVYECSKTGNTVTLKVSRHPTVNKTDSCQNGIQSIYTCSSDNKGIKYSKNTCKYRCSSDGITCDDNECNTSADCSDSSKPKCEQNACVACENGTFFDSSTNTCVECTTDNVSNCTEGQRCDDNTCVDDIKPVTPILECVMDNGDNTFTAYFGYENNNQSAVTITPCDTTSEDVNSITGLEAKYCDQLSEFTTGRVKGAFSVIVPSDKTITWTLQNGGNEEVSAEASINSTACANVTPVAKCIDINKDGSFEAYFGYKNDNAFEVVIPSGVNNFASPEAGNLPTLFTAGKVENAVSIKMTYEASWTLNGVTATADTTLATCSENNAPTCQASSYTAECQGTETKVELDGSVCADQDGNTLTYSWETDCEGAILQDETTSSPTLILTAPAEGQDVECTVILTVTDGLLSATSTQSIQVAACDLDCLNEPNGTAKLDDCGVCNGDNSTCTDCAGEIYGDAKEDKCGVCGGNNECLDCAGTPNGDAKVDECGICGEDGATCAQSGCIETNISSQKTSLNGDEFIKMLKKQSKLLLKDDPSYPYIRVLESSVKRRLNRANKLNNQIKKLVVAFSDVITSCQDDTNCTSVSNQNAIRVINAKLRKLKAQVGRTIRQRNLPQAKIKNLLNKNAKLLTEKLNILDSIPTVNNICKQ